MSKHQFVAPLGLALLALVGCNNDTSTPPADLGPVDLATVDGTHAEAGVDLGQTDLGQHDLGQQDLGLHDASPGDKGADASPPQTDRKTGELASGGQVSTGGSYSLSSQVGHAMATSAISGGNYALHWNASVIPW